MRIRLPGAAGERVGARSRRLTSGLRARFGATRPEPGGPSGGREGDSASDHGSEAPESAAGRETAAAAERDRAADPTAGSGAEGAASRGGAAGGGPAASLSALRDRLPRPSWPAIEPPSEWSREGKIAGGVGALLLAAAIGLALGSLLAGDGGGSGPSPAPTAVVEPEPEPDPAAAEEIGFPGFATLNTTRVGGSNPTANAAGVALASYPSVGGVGGPDAVVLAPADSWQGAIAAASLTAEPIGAPVLLGSANEIPGFTAEALSGLAPGGLERADGVQLIAVGDVVTPEGLKTVEIEADGAAELAAAIDRQRGRLGGAAEPQHIVVVSSNDAAMAMPAAAWAARSGDPIVFADGDDVPDATLKVIERHPEATVYVLGPESVISDSALRRLEKAGGQAIRIEGPDPVTNSIAFARFLDGAFGWNINDPGHGFAIANAERPADAAAAAPLSSGGKPGPLLVTDDAAEVPRPLRNFLLDTKPGFTDDPSRALYNHVWLLGDTDAISLAFQAQVDELVELERVRRGRGVPDFGPQQGAPEEELPPKRAR